MPGNQLADRRVHAHAVTLADERRVHRLGHAVQQLELERAVAELAPLARTTIAWARLRRLWLAIAGRTSPAWSIRYFVHRSKFASVSAFRANTGDGHPAAPATISSWSQ